MKPSNGDVIEVEFKNGDTEKLTVQRVDEKDTALGAAVEIHLVNHKVDPTYYKGQIYLEKDYDEVLVAFEREVGEEVDFIGGGGDVTRAINQVSVVEG